MNKGLAWTALTGMALCQLPGILAHMHNLYYGDSLHTKPKYLRRFLAMRKHLGLISFFFLIVHIFMSTLLFGPNYYGALFEEPKNPMSKMSLNGELAYMLGTFAAAFYCILAICSLPAVAELMTNRQWQFVYGPVAQFGLFCATFHVISQGIGVSWNKKATWPWGMPPISLMSTVLPMFIMALKICQVVWSKTTTKKYTYSNKDILTTTKNYIFSNKDIQDDRSHTSNYDDSSETEEMSVQV
jgi:Ferric reductase like transmembrane component